MKISQSLAAIFLLTAIAAQAEPVPIFGLPLGGKLNLPLPVCPENTDRVKSPCWVGPPYKGENGWRSGRAHLPHPDGRPRWAAHAVFDVSIAGNGRLDAISVQATTKLGTTKKIIADSISARFGQPILSTNHGAEWNHPDVHIRMLCDAGEWCRVTFESEQSYEEWKRQRATHEQREAKRPISP